MITQSNIRLFIFACVRILFWFFAFNAIVKAIILLTPQ